MGTLALGTMMGPLSAQDLGAQLRGNLGKARSQTPMTSDGSGDGGLASAIKRAEANDVERKRAAALAKKREEEAAFWERNQEIKAQCAQSFLLTLEVIVPGESDEDRARRHEANGRRATERRKLCDDYEKAGGTAAAAQRFHAGTSALDAQISQLDQKRASLLRDSEVLARNNRSFAAPQPAPYSPYSPKQIAQCRAETAKRGYPTCFCEGVLHIVNKKRTACEK